MKDVIIGSHKNDNVDVKKDDNSVINITPQIFEGFKDVDFKSLKIVSSFYLNRDKGPYCLLA